MHACIRSQLATSHAIADTHADRSLVHILTAAPLRHVGHSQPGAARGHQSHPAAAAASCVSATSVHPSLSRAGRANHWPPTVCPGPCHVCNCICNGLTGRNSPAMYSSASRRVRVGSALSPAFAVQRGVAQGCPLFPLLYAIFVDPVLRDMQALSHPDLLWVGPAVTRRKLVGQAYADDLAGIAATQQGLQRFVQAVHLHSLRWGWMLNVTSRLLWCSGHSHCVPD